MIVLSKLNFENGIACWMERFGDWYTYIHMLGFYHAVLLLFIAIKQVILKLSE